MLDFISSVKIYLTNSYLFVAVFFLYPLFCLAQQTHQLTDKTQDSLQNPIPNTNMIATPLAEDADITFAISSLENEYKLKLQNNITYQIAITYRTDQFKTREEHKHLDLHNQEYPPFREDKGGCLFNTNNLSFVLY